MEVRELLYRIVQGLVDRPDEVKINHIDGESLVVVEIRVADDDVRKALGKKGANAEALRQLFGAVYGREGKRLHLQVIDPRRQ
jgi:hypothetical protein